MLLAAVIAMLALGQAAAGATPNTIRLAEGAARPASTIADVAWLAGSWEGEGLGGTVDEVWSEPGGGAMVGYFRLVKDGKAVFCGLRVLDYETASILSEIYVVQAESYGALTEPIGVALAVPETFRAGSAPEILRMFAWMVGELLGNEEYLPET
jgi:hypothetical protein